MPLFFPCRKKNQRFGVGFWLTNLPMLAFQGLSAGADAAL